MAIYRTAVQSTYATTGGPGVNTWHFRTTLAQDTGSQLLIDAGQALLAFYTAIAGQFPQSMRFEWDGQWTQVDGETFLAPGGGWTRSGAASSATGYLSPATAICITWRSTEASASGRGRTFLGPLSQDVLEANGTPAEIPLGIIRGAAADLIETFAGPEPGDEGGFGVYSRTDGVIRDFVASSVPNQFATLRSRRD